MRRTGCITTGFVWAWRSDWAGKRFGVCLYALRRADEDASACKKKALSLFLHTKSGIYPDNIGYMPLFLQSFQMRALESPRCRAAEHAVHPAAESQQDDTGQAEEQAGARGGRRAEGGYRCIVRGDVHGFHNQQVIVE